MASSHIGQESTETAARDIGQMRNRTEGGVRGRKTKVGRKLLRFPPTRLFSAPCYFCVDRYSLHDFVPIKRFRWYKVYLLRRFVPRKRFKWYERVLETCFVREKRFRRNESRLQDRAQAVGFYAIPFRTELRPSAMRFSPSSRSSRGHARLMRMNPSPASPYIEPALTWT